MRKLNKKLGLGLIALGVLGSAGIASASPFHRDRLDLRIGTVGIGFETCAPVRQVIVEPAPRVEVIHRGYRFERREDRFRR
jgi:hypothetical protein